MSNCTDCLLDLTDACPRGSGRAIDDEICDSFFPRETYQVNKNESWQLGYQQGRADVIDKVIEYLNCEFIKQNNPHSELVPTIVLNIGFIETLEQLKEQTE